MSNKENIEAWERECKQALEDGDIWKAVQCRILADKLREDETTED